MTKDQQLRFDLYAAFRGGDWFTCHLFRLFNKADMANKIRLGQAFPDEWLVYQAWERAEDEGEFFADLETERHLPRSTKKGA